MSRRWNLAISLATFLLAVPAAGSGLERRDVKHTVPARPGLVVRLENLAGRVTVDGAQGGDVELTGTVTAEAGSDAEAKKLAASLDVTFEPQGDRLLVHAKYPVAEHDVYRYPERERNGRGGEAFFEWLGGNRTEIRYQGRRVTVVSGRHGRAVTLYADFHLRVPDGVSVEVKNAVGRIEARDVKGGVKLESDCGDVKARGGSGAFHAATGSGDVRLDDQRGDVSVDTGSGDVVVAHVKGDTSVETGSGDVHMNDVSGTKVSATTGSGDVSLRRIAGSLEMETGSGDIQAEGVSGVERVRAETGSGSVVLQGDLSGLKEMKLSTSSGDVDVSLEKAVPMSLHASTVSGDIDVDLPDTKTVRKREHSLVAEVGGGGADVQIDTVSGSVRMVTR